MEEVGFLPKPTNELLPVHRATTVSETFGLLHFPPEHLHVTGTSRRSDMHTDGSTAESLMFPRFLSQSAAPPAATNENTNLDEKGAGRKKTNVADPTRWKQNKQKQLRMEGRAYVSKRKKDGEMVTKQPRTVGPRCTSSVCSKAFNRLCDEIDEDVRKRLFEEFWHGMNWPQRKLYVTRHVDCNAVERSRAVGPRSRRSVSLRYHLLVDGKRKRVCKNMFLSTLGIGEWSVLNWAQNGASNKNKLSEHKLQKMNAGRQCPRQRPASSPVCYTVQVTLEPATPAELEGPARKKSRVAKPLTWKQNQQKQLRMEGKSYISKRKKDGETVTKAQRTIGPRCSSSACRRASNRFCADFSEEARNLLFTAFWQSMNWAQRKIYVSGLVDCDPVERTRAPLTKSRRSVSMRYHLMFSGDRRQVCKKMFLATLGIGEWSVLNWAQNSPEEPDDPDENAKKQTQRTSRKASEHHFLNQFLESLPKAPSYCCGASISKLYVEPVFSNMSSLYRHYYHHCTDKKTTALSRQVFCSVFKKMDLRLCDPRKYQGCALGATGNFLNEEFCMDRGGGLNPQLERETGFKDNRALC